MLLHFRVSNFLSIRDEIEFNAEPTQEANHRQRIAHGPHAWVKILPTSAFFGPNGSGKSNFIRAVEFAKLLVVFGTEPGETIPRRIFKLDPACEHKPTTFEFVILANEKVYRYAFSVDSKRVLSEELTELRAASEKPIFSRTSDRDTASTFDLPYLKARSFKAEDRQFAQFVARGTRPNQLFLRECQERNLLDFADVFRWFDQQLVVLHPHTRHAPLEIDLKSQGDLRAFASRALSAADTGIVRISSNEIPLSAIDLPESFLDELRKNLQSDGEGLFAVDPDGHRYGIYREKGEIHAYRMVTYHEGAGGDPIAFDLAEESDGTQRMIDLIPGLHAMVEDGLPRTYLVDELDRSLHPNLAKWFVRTFLEGCDHDTRTQLIFTTHSSELIDQSLLRRDETWLVEKDSAGATQIEAVSDYENVRIDTDIRKGYLHGIYTGVPHLRHLPLKTRSDGKTAEQPELSFHG